MQYHLLNALVDLSWILETIAYSWMLSFFNYHQKISKYPFASICTLSGPWLSNVHPTPDFPMGQLCQRRAPPSTEPLRPSAEAVTLVTKKHDPKRYANDYSRCSLKLTTFLFFLFFFTSWIAFLSCKFLRRGSSLSISSTQAAFHAKVHEVYSIGRFFCTISNKYARCSHGAYTYMALTFLMAFTWFSRCFAQHWTVRFDHIEDSDEDQAPKEEPPEEPMDPDEPHSVSEEQRRELKLKCHGKTPQKWAQHLIYVSIWDS